MTDYSFVAVLDMLGYSNKTANFEQLDLDRFEHIASKAVQASALLLEDAGG